MSQRSSDDSAPRKSSPQQENRPKRGTTTVSHRLRGDEVADDFADAEGDSSVVASRRVDKQSDS